MQSKFIDALKAGQIIAVEWEPIQEMLGEAPSQVLACSICEDRDNFPPVVTKTAAMTEKEILGILGECNVQWMAEAHDPNAPLHPLLGRIMMRYFAMHKPSVGPWMRSPHAM